MADTQIAVFGGGCFWCTEAFFKMLRGVVSIAPGYAGGTTQNPTYEEVCTGETGHVEVIQIIFDPAQITFENLLDVFFATHDPTTINRQGNDVGTQYRSIIFYTSPAQQVAAEKYIADANASSAAGRSIITAVEPLTKFWEAENYHHDYFARNKDKPYCQVVINPKLQKAKENFGKLLR